MIDQVFEAAALVDQAFAIILGIAVGILVLVTALMAVFVVRYHHKRHPVAVETPGNIWLELLWTVIPAILVMGMFWVGWGSWKAMRAVPEDAMVVQVEGRMWSWAFTYPGGKRSSDLVAPVDTPVRLEMTTADVIHSFYVPAMRIKMDTVPGMTTTVWFKSDSEGEFDILCAEYCGLKHANMIATLKVVGGDEFQQWLGGGSGKGAELLENYGCTACHSLDGEDGVGPTFKGIAGRRFEAELPDGTFKEMVADEKYLRRAILQPDAEYVRGYSPAMPAYEGAIPEDELKAMVAYLMTGDATVPPAGREIAEAEGCLSCHSTDGSVVAGPSLKNVYGATRRAAGADGAVREVVANEAYLAESILRPEALVTEGFDAFMPPYDHLTKEQVDALVAWIRGLGEGG